MLFLGTPAYAVPSLDALLELARDARLSLAAVITQPDRPAHRGALQAPAVKRRALEHGLAVRQPARLDRAAVEALAALGPDALVWAAYGNRVPQALLDAVGGRAVNVHASLLPRWRGAAPVAHAILAGDLETGVTLMEGTAALDAGPILATRRTPIRPDEDAEALTARLGALGGALLAAELPGYLAGELRPTPQDERRATWAPKLTTADGALSFAEPAEALLRRVRAMTPDPGAWTTFRGQRIVVTRAAVADGPGAAHGTFAIRERVPQVAAGAGWLRLDGVKPAGKGAMSGAAWARGLRDLRAGEQLPS